MPLLTEGAAGTLTPMPSNLHTHAQTNTNIQKTYTDQAHRYKELQDNNLLHQTYNSRSGTTTIYTNLEVSVILNAACATNARQITSIIERSGHTHAHLQKN